MANPNEYNSDNVSTSQQQDLNPYNVSGPPVPHAGGAGAGQTVVNTHALATFGSNINELVPYVRTAQLAVNSVPPAAAGAFDKAWTIQGQITGDGTTATSGTDIKTAYGNVLTDLSKGLNDLIGAVQTMVQKYTTTDDLNNMAVSDLQQSLDSTTGDFSNIITDDGGGASTTSS
jgi:hypothetical protein